jgi:hypothetical protein
MAAGPTVTIGITRMMKDDNAFGRLLQLSALGEKPMKIPVILAVAASTILFGAPLAQAFQQVESNSVPAVNAARVADPDDIMNNMDNEASGNGGVVTPLSNSFHFGRSTTGGNSPFLESPASRTVPSQAR